MLVGETLVLGLLLGRVLSLPRDLLNLLLGLLDLLLGLRLWRPPSYQALSAPCACA